MALTRIFEQLVTMSLQASWLVLAILVLRIFLKKGPKWSHCLLWAMVGLRLVCPVSVESNLSLVPRIAYGDMEVMDDYVGNTHTYWDITEEFDIALEAGIEPLSGGEGGYYVVTGDTPQEMPTTVADLLPEIWLLGLGAMLVYAGVSYSRLRRRTDASICLQDNLYLCDYIETPFILGLIKPKIYLPSSMDPNAASFVLAHERAHIRRKDHWWKPIGFLILALHWFNPLIWLAYMLLCRDIELACDERVVREMGALDRKAYSEALLTCSVPRYLVAACPLAFGEVGVKERVKSVLNYKKPAFWAVLMAVAVCIGVGVCFLTDPESEPEEPTVSYTYESPHQWAAAVRREDIHYASASLHEEDWYSNPLAERELTELVETLNRLEAEAYLLKQPEGAEDPLWNNEGAKVWLMPRMEEAVLLRYVQDTVILSAETGSDLWPEDGYWTVESEELKMWLRSLACGGTDMLSEENREEVRQLLKMSYVEFFDPQSFGDMLFVGCSYDYERGLGVACFRENGLGGYNLVQVLREADVHPCDSGSKVYYCDFSDIRVFLVQNESMTAMEWTELDGTRIRHELDGNPSLLVVQSRANSGSKYRFCYSDGNNTTMYMDYDRCHHEHTGQ